MAFMMELKDLIISQLKLRMNPEDYDKIDVMFSEMYLIEENGQEILCLKPYDEGVSVEDTSLMFYTINGAYYDMGQWSYIQKIGKRV